MTAADVLVRAGLMADVPPCTCGKTIASTCVHHSPEWLRICGRLADAERERRVLAPRKRGEEYLALPSPHYVDDQITLYHGDALDIATRGLDDESVDCIVTSPPYYGLRDYGTKGQYGLEASPAEYVETMRTLFSELRRVLAHDGTLWLNIGDSYSSGGRATCDVKAGNTRSRGHSAIRPTGDLPGKNLLGMPWRVAFALQDDGWILRNDIVWAKPNGMPESVTDRMARKHEHVLMFAKAPAYWFDLDAVREPHAETSIARSGRNRFAIDQSQQGVGSPNTVDPKQAVHPLGRNPGDVWTIPTQPFAAAHFAVMPLALAERCVASGCKPGGTVLDPFSGSGTTGVAAQNLGHKYIGIDLNANYLNLSLTHSQRLAQGSLL